MSERFKYKPEEIEEAHPETKTDFLNYVDMLTEKSKISKALKGMEEFGDQRGLGIKLGDGRQALVFYNMLPDKAQPEYTHAQLNIYEMLDENHEKSTVFYMRKNSLVDKYVEIRDLKKDSDELDELRKLHEMDGGSEKILDSLEKQKEKIEKVIDAQKEAAELGMSLVTEAELLEINALLKQLLEKQKENARKV